MTMMTCTLFHLLYCSGLITQQVTLPNYGVRITFKLIETE